MPEVEAYLTRAVFGLDRDVADPSLIARVELQADRVPVVFPDADREITDRARGTSRMLSDSPAPCKIVRFCAVPA